MVARQGVTTTSPPSISGAVDPSRLFADEAGSRAEVELPAVVGARQRVAEDVPLVERIALVRARVREGVRLALDHEDGDLRPVDLDDRAAVPVEAGQRDSQRLHAA